MKIVGNVPNRGYFRKSLIFQAIRDLLDQEPSITMKDYIPEEKQNYKPEEIITAKVLMPRAGDDRPALRNVIDGKIGFGRNAQDQVWQEHLQPGDRVYVKLDHNSIKEYSSYKYWIGFIVGKLA